MVTWDIFRPQTDSEKKDFKDISRRTQSIRDKFKETLDEKEYTANRDKVIFDSRCARIDFEKLLDDNQRLLAESNGMNDELIAEINKFKFKDYYSLEGFVLGKVVHKKVNFHKIRSVAAKNSNINGIKEKVQIGWFYNFVCKKRLCGIAIEVPFKDNKTFLKYIVKSGTDKMIDQLKEEKVYGEIKEEEKPTELVTPPATN